MQISQGLVMDRRVRQRVGLHPIFNSLPEDILQLIYEFATADYFAAMANRIRTAYRVFRRRAGKLIMAWVPLSWQDLGAVPPGVAVHADGNTIYQYVQVVDLT